MYRAIALVFFVEPEAGVLEGGNAPERMPREIARRRPLFGEDVNRQKFIFDAFFNQTEPDNPDIAAVAAPKTRGFSIIS